MPDPRSGPARSKLFLTLVKRGVPADEAFAFVQRAENMADRDVRADVQTEFAKFDAALEARRAKLEDRSAKLEAAFEATLAMLDAQLRQLRTLRWMIGLGFTSLAILITVLALLA